MKQYAGALLVLGSLGAVAAIGVGCDNASDATTAGGGATGGAGAPVGGAGAPVGGAGAPVGGAGAPVGGAGAPASAGAAGTSTGTGMSDTLPANAVEVALTPSATGFVDSAATGVVGAWYSYGDGNEGATPMGVCQTKGMHMTSECSAITTPLPGEPFAPAGTSLAQMCTSGTVAKIIPFGTPPALDYSNLFGAGIGLDFNNPGLDGGTGVKMPFNAPGKMVIGVSFDLDAVPLPGIRVEFPFSAPDAAIWKPATAAKNYVSPVSAGHNVLLFANVTQPAYVAAAAKVPFDPATLLSIQFHVPTTATAAAAYSFCVDNLKLVVQM
jgi:hypothetical protein